MSEDNPLRLPWRVEYGNDWREGVYVDKIRNCDGYTVVETDMGVYGPEKLEAEAIVSAVNEKYGDDWKKKVVDPIPVPFELPIGPCTPPTEVFHVPQGPCDPLPEPWVQPPQVT